MVMDQQIIREALQNGKTLKELEEKHGFKILQLNTDIDAGAIRLYTALLVHKKNKLRQQFIDAYLELVDREDEK